MAAPVNYNLQDDGYGWEFELDFSEFDTQVIIEWIYILDDDFGDDYEEKFTIQSITGEHFKRNQLGNEQWCRSELGMNPQTAKLFSSVVRRRITKHENIKRNPPQQTPIQYQSKHDDNTNNNNSVEIPSQTIGNTNNKWNCSICTFENLYENKQCTMCNVGKCPNITNDNKNECNNNIEMKQYEEKQKYFGWKSSIKNPTKTTPPIENKHQSKPALPPSVITFRQLCQLTQLGINKTAIIKYNNITMDSDRCIVVREENRIWIVNTSTSKATPLNVTVDSAIMNPSTNVLGLRSKNNLQIFDFDMRTRMKTTEAADAVLYWRWVDSHTIAYVTNKAVYHWSMEDDIGPVTKFYIPSEVMIYQVEIIGYDVSADNNWLLLQGIVKSTIDNSVEGVLQLYNVPLDTYQPKLNAHGG
eukprot:286193_1